MIKPKMYWIILIKSCFNPFDISNVNICPFILHLEVRISTIVIRHYNNPNVLCPKQKLFSRVYPRTSFNIQTDLFPLLVFLCLTMSNRVCPSLEMVYYHCFTRHYSILYFTQHFLSFLCELYYSLPNFRVYSCMLFLTIRILFRVKDVLYGKQFINMAIVIYSNTFLICKTSFVFPFAKLGNLLRTA